MDGHLPIFKIATLPEPEKLPAVAAKYIKRHSSEFEYLEKLEAYYCGKQASHESEK